MIGIFLARTNQCPNLDIYFLSIPSHLWRFDRCIASRRYSVGAPNLYWGLTSLVTTFLFFLTLGCWNMMIYLCHPGICDCCYKGRSWFRGLVGLVGLVGPVGLVVRMKKRMLMNLLAKLKTISSIKFQERYQPWTFFKIKEQQWYHPKNHYTNLHFLLIRKTNNHCHLLF